MISKMFDLYWKYKMKNKTKFFGYYIVLAKEEPLIRQPKFGDPDIDRVEHKMVTLTLQK
jgi:hypothetical protein